ncbi:2-oxo acid dehydrogenase subunit E2 [Fodinisporobacter ferrooxydans]|uniref:Dihydrolipoamide acetyltransferase component of pyruvate dehydrogenase complex n=1 Tax=Fodinisporobacter ferrooxydans TaxID=2901836 RepID=A0ABY4CP83_9BACL|nr:2-oxo acid dehydrogenase subunit E2 [Alicyclobacillaceae bacterium MYW30-H2]
MAVFEFKLPDIGEGIHEGEITKWLVKSGDAVTEDQPIVEVQTDKILVELPSPVNGKVVEIKIQEGTIATVGDIIVTFEVEGAGNAAASAQAAATPAQTATATATAAKTAAPAAAATAQAAPETNAEVLATPSVRKYAREKGVTLTTITGTGRNNRITRDDVDRAAGGAPTAQAQAAEVAAAPTAQTASAPETNAAPAAVQQQTVVAEERVPLKGIRKAIANAMAKSMYTAPHVTIMDEVDVTKLVELRKKQKATAEQKGVKLTYLPFIVKAIVSGLREFPVLNASLDDEKEEIIYKYDYHIGIATDTDQGLLVPVVKSADRKSMLTIAKEISDLAVRGREGKLTLPELKGSTFTITNIGSAGGMFFTPIINYPEVAILGVGRIAEKPVVRDGELAIAPVLALSLSFDHRLIDGATAQYFMNHLKRLLSDPEVLLMEV